MNIVVCIKEVPDTDKVRIDPETKTLVREGIPVIVNPDDMIALEFALNIKEKLGEQSDVLITALSMGPPHAEESLMKTYLNGADRCILLTDRKLAGSDTYATSYILSCAIRKLDADLVICGKQAIDGDTAQVGPGIAEHLNLPQLTYAVSAEGIEESSITVKRELDNFFQTCYLKLPALLTVNSNSCPARYPSIKRFMKISEFEVEKWTVDDIEGNEENFGLDGSPTKVINIFTPPPASSGKIFSDSGEGVKEIKDFLKNTKHI